MWVVHSVMNFFFVRVLDILQSFTIYIFGHGSHSSQVIWAQTNDAF